MILPVQLELLALGSFRSIPSPLVVTLAGMALCTPALVALCGRLVPARPAALRLAARDAARNPGRSGPAVTAVAAGLGMLVVLAGLRLPSPDTRSSGLLVPAEAGYPAAAPGAGVPAGPAGPAGDLHRADGGRGPHRQRPRAGRGPRRPGRAGAAGASPGTHRALAAASAWLLTELGALVGALAGLSPLLIERLNRWLWAPFPMDVPWATLALVVLARPGRGRGGRRPGRRPAGPLPDRAPPGLTDA